MMDFDGVFADRRILVTGHTGFKGSWLALWLHHLGASVSACALAPHTDPSHYALLRLDEMIASQFLDIREFDSLHALFDRLQPEIVFHLAAQSLVRRSYGEPRMTFDTNIGGTVNVLEAVRGTPSVKACVIVTSDKCYENREWVWGYRENDPVGGRDPYSASKGAAEIVTRSYERSFFSVEQSDRVVGCATVRGGNVIGGGDWAGDRIIPDCVRSLSLGMPIALRNPSATRPWQHVLDPLSGYLLLAGRLLEAPQDYAGAWNFGPITPGSVTVEDIARRFVDAWGEGDISLPGGGPNELHEAHLLHLNIDRALRELLWQPRLDVHTAIDWTVTWYQQFYRHRADMRSVSLEQIDRYMRLDSPAKDRNL